MTRFLVMRILSVISIVSLLFFGVSICNAKKYILDKKDYLPVVGTVRESQSLIKTIDAKLTISVQENIMDGIMGMTMSKVEEDTVLSPTKVRVLIKHGLSTGTVTIGGQEVPSPEKKEPLLNVGVIMELKDGKWKASPEKGKFSAEQKEEVAKMVKKANSGVSMYGYEAREVDDEWEVGFEALKHLLGDEDITKGTASVTFKGVKEHAEKKHAELAVHFEVEGKKDEGTQKMTGDVIILRDLEYFVDAKVDGKMDMEMQGEVNPGVMMNMSAKGVISQEVTVKVPVSQ